MYRGSFRYILPLLLGLGKSYVIPTSLYRGTLNRGSTVLGDFSFAERVPSVLRTHKINLTYFSVDQLVTFLLVSETKHNLSFPV